MSLQTKSVEISEPIYYHREYANDIDEPSYDRSWADDCKRVGTVALPFFSLYKPLSQPISLAMGGLRSVTCIVNLIESIKGGNCSEVAYMLLQTVIAVIALAGTIFAHPAGMLITTGHDLIIELTHLIQHLYVGEHQKALESCLNIANNALYLVLFLDGGLEIAIASLAVQILVGLSHSMHEFQNGRWLEGAGHLLMATIRGNQLSTQVKTLQMKWEMEGLIQKASESRSKNLKTLGLIGFSASFGNATAKDLAEVSPLDHELNILTKYENNSLGIPPLLCAIQNGDLDAVKLLVKNGADINAVAQSGKKCAITAAFPFPEILKFLIDSGADINIKLAQKQTPLHYASQYEDTFEALCILIENGACVNAADLYGRTPLHSGIYFGKTALALLKNGADIHAKDDDGWKPLHRAYTYGDIELLKELSKRGCSMNEFTPNGANALHHAAGRNTDPNCLNLVRWLIEEQKMDVNAWGKWHDRVDGALTPFMWAVSKQKALDENFELLEYLLKRGADINAKIHYGNNPPHCGTVLNWAKIWAKCPKYVLNWLIQHGAT